MSQGVLAGGPRLAQGPSRGLQSEKTAVADARESSPIKTRHTPEQIRFLRRHKTGYRMI
jgi:hypothetical protein